MAHSGRAHENAASAYCAAVCTICGHSARTAALDRYGQVFVSFRAHGARPLSDATMLNALRRMGYQKDEMSVHGFRSIASTLLNELGYNRDWIERQLAHGERNEVRAAYNYAEYLPERRRMMQEWANYLDRLRTGKSEQA